ncbi:MAG TPA: NAD-dependent epimerase/dehydratase family protein, partial [Candidatus Acetothermia bacterium]|nr:NAD-dependent epimerase/dehydratase family protein [Candidatus Acetothermia bacterium]
MKALVTGGTGFIGSSIVRALLRDGHDVRALVREGSDTRNLAGLNIERVTGDITDPKSLSAAMSGCTHVFHAAALYSFWVTLPGLIERVNVGGTRNVLQAALDARIERVVYTSSVAALAVPSRDR